MVLASTSLNPSASVLTWLLRDDILIADDVNCDSSEQMFELSRCEASVFYNSAHRDRIHGIVSRDGDEMRAVTHHDMFSLTDNFESSLFKCPNRPERLTPGIFGIVKL